VVAARETTGASDLDATLTAIVERAARLAGADVVIARLADESGGLVAHAVHARSESVRAELEGSRIEAAAAPAAEDASLEELPRELRAAAERIAAVGVLRLPVRDDGSVVGSVELFRSRTEFDELQVALARAAADEVALAWRAFSGEASRAARDPLELAGEALSAGSAETHAPEQVAHLAAEATDASACLVWDYEEGDRPVLSALAGPSAAAAPAYALEVLLRACDSREPVTVELVGEPGWLVTLRLGEPPVGALQLLFAQEPDPAGPLLPRLATFAVRAAHALRTSERRRTLAADLDRTRALLTIVGQAIAELSLTHTLDTAVDRVRELLSVEGLAVYLLAEDGERLETAAERGLTGPHVRIGERLLELALGPAPWRGLVLVEDAATDPRLAVTRDAIEEIGIKAAMAVPLRAGDEVIGLLAVYPERGRTLTENEESLLRALVAQLAVAVQNAQLHEKVERESGEAKRARDEEAEVSRRLRALYEISRSFTESLSLEEAFDVVVRTIVGELDVDAAVLRIPHERGDALVPAATHVRDERLAQPLQRILSLPQPLSPVRPSVYRSGEVVMLDGETARALGPAHEPLIPFLDQGSTGAVIPLAAHERILGTLTLLSLRVEKPIGPETLSAAVSIAGPTALALDNARLQQQRKEFTETMQNTLLPRSRPELPGLEIGAVYEQATRVEVGGDVYDFLELPDSRLAVVLGDVTGHGIDAAADMAMAKFVFRSLAREHPEPGDFLTAANEVVLGEIGATKFITLLYLTVDPRNGEVACASAGHPSPRLVRPGLAPEGIDVAGLALGIEGGQHYMPVHLRLEPGAVVALYTDGLPEARRAGELYGEKRLNDALLANIDRPAEEIAEALVQDCRDFAGELSDDLAVVILKRVPASPTSLRSSPAEPGSTEA
jgi:serine phosphatase RsbU (regulator of sigma subunit)